MKLRVMYQVEPVEGPPKVIKIPRQVLENSDIEDYAVVGNNLNTTVVRVEPWEEYKFTTSGMVMIVTVALDKYTAELLKLHKGDFVTIEPAHVIEEGIVKLAPDKPLSNEEKDRIKQILEGKVVSRGDKIPVKLGEKGIILTVVRIDPEDADGILVGGTTQLIFTRPAKEKGGVLLDVTFDDIGGYEEVKKKVHDFIIGPLTNPHVYEEIGFTPPKGVLITGPPGVGKTMFVKAIANAVDAELIYTHAADIISDSYIESKTALKSLFDRATSLAPSILCIEDIDMIAPKRSSATVDVEKKMTSYLMSLMDNLNTPGVIVIGTSSQPDEIEPALKRAGRFDKEIELPVPDIKMRAEILKTLTKGLPLAVEFSYDNIKPVLKKLKKDDIIEALSPYMKADDIETYFKRNYPDLYEKIRDELLKDVFMDIAKRTHGFVGADLEALVREAMLHAMKRAQTLGLDAKHVAIAKEDFLESLKYVEPSALKEILIELPQVHWDDIGGYEEVKAQLQEVIEWPLVKPYLFEATGIEPPKGVLLYGPPGTGKTLLAKAVATESGANFIAIKGPEILSKWVGESERRIREVFRKARQVAPTIIFIDEIDSIGQRRGSEKMQHVDSIINQLLTEMDGLEERGRVVVIAATNRPDILDPALLRPGRFDRLILIPAPDEKARLEILKVHTRGVPLKNVNLENLAKRTEGYSGADLEALVREATILAIRRVLDKIREDMSAEEIRNLIAVTEKDFEEALKKVKPSITKSTAQYYENLEKNLKNIVAIKRSEYGRIW